ncbi:ribonuclease Z [archaeon]|nr:MAG: ribonuclease Z [archaeon]
MNGGREVKVTFLGTGGSVPTKKRNLPSLAVRTDGGLVMFDCGEGTQKQFLIAKLGFNREMRILISHMHADHILGIPGILHSMSFMGRSRDLEIYGPPGICEFVKCTTETVKFRPMFPIRTVEVHAGTIARTDSYAIKAAWADHSVPCLAYSLTENDKPGRFHPAKARELGVPKGPLWKTLQMGKPVKVGRRRIDASRVVDPPRKGLKITYGVDTRPCERVIELASGSDLLIHDGMFSSDASERAREYGHSTVVEAAKIAKRSHSRNLALTHFSAIYADTSQLLAEAKAIFPRTIVAEDLRSLELP